MKRMLISLFFLMLFLGQTAYCQDFISDEKTVFKNDIYKNANIIDNSSNIKGDGIFIGSNIKNSSDVAGDILGLSVYTLEINNTVGGNIRAIAGNADITAQVYKNITMLSGEITLNKDSIVYGNLYTVSNTIKMEGTIKGDAYIVSNNITINGDINGRLVINSGDSNNISVLPASKLAGQIIHYGKYKIESLKGSDNYTFIEISPKAPVIYNIIYIICEYLLMLIIGVLILLLLSKTVIKQNSLKGENHAKIFLIGIIKAIILIAVIMLFITILSICLYYKLSIIWVPLTLLTISALAYIYFASINAFIEIGKLFPIKNKILSYILGTTIFFVIIIALYIISVYMSQASIIAGALITSLRIIAVVYGLGLCFVKFILISNKIIE